MRPSGARCRRGVSAADELIKSPRAFYSRDSASQLRSSHRSTTSIFTLFAREQERERKVNLNYLARQFRRDEVSLLPDARGVKSRDPRSLDYQPTRITVTSLAIERRAV